MAMHFSEEDQKKLREDSSEIYKKRTEESEKKAVESLDAKGKLRYFFDYYFKYVIAVGVIAAVLAAVFYESFRRRPTDALYVLVRHDAIEDDKLEEFAAAVEDYLGIDKRIEQVTVELCPSDIKLQTYLFAKTADVVIMDADNFERWGNADYFFTAEEDKLVSFYQDYEEKYRYRARHLTVEDQVSQKEDESAEPEDTFEYNCALYLTDSEKYKQISVGIKEPVIAISKGTKHKEDAVKFVKYMMDNEVKLNLKGD
ncbi:MAG: hypothetical protein IJ733_19875 [Lachnospiraceae bacterium]|nr:hypothetical protein [Lachnospiraceae bacterium]